jgi:hypothetical protein
MAAQGTTKRRNGAPRRQPPPGKRRQAPARIDVRGAKGEHARSKSWWERENRVIFDDGKLLELELLPERILHFSCTQAPFHHLDAIPFLRAVKDSYCPDLVVMHGDEADLQFLKKAFMGPESPGPLRELEETTAFMAELGAVFPEMLLLSSNHVDGRIRYAKAQSNIPTIMLRPWRDLIEAPRGWEWRKYVVCRNWWWEHGDDVAKGNRGSIVEYTAGKFGRPLSVMKGHVHSEHGDFIRPVWVSATQQLRLVFTGCLMGEEHATYTKGVTRNGCVVMLRGAPLAIPMPKDKRGRWTGELAQW